MSTPIPPSPNPSLPPAWTSALWGALTAAIAIGLRIPFLGESLWVDELHTAWVVAEDPSVIPLRAAMGNQSPLYFYGIWGVIQTLGMHEWSLRLPSLIASAVGVGLTTAIAHRWTRSAALAIGVGLIAAIDFDGIFFGTEARAYALVQLVAILQVASAWDAVQNDRPRSWWAWALLSVFNFYLHYSTILFTGSLGLVMLAYASSRQARIRLVIAGCGVLAGAAVSLPHLLAIFERRGNWALFVSATSTGEWMRWGRLLAVLLPVAAALLAGWFRRNATEPTDTRRVTFLAAVILVPFGVAWTTTATGVAALFLGRFLFSIEAILPLLLAAMVAIAPRSWLVRGALLASVLIAVQLRLPSYPLLAAQSELPVNGEIMRGEDWRTVTKAASQRIETMPEPPTILIDAGLIETDILLRETDTGHPWEAYARLPIETIYALPGEANRRFGLTNTDTGKPTPRYLRESQPGDTIVLLVRGNRRSADHVAETFRRSLPERQYDVETPQPQADLVQWRILVPAATAQVPPAD